MRLSKEEIAKNGEKKTPVDELVEKHGDKYRSALEKAEKSIYDMVNSVKQNGKKLPSSFYREVTATCNVYKDKIVQGTAVPDEFQKTLDEIKDAVSKGEFKQEAKTSTAKKPQTAKAPKDTANTFQKIHFDKDKKYVSTPEPTTKLGYQVSEKFYQFEQSLKTQGISLSINAINAIKIKRNKLVNMADFSKTADTAIQKTDEQLAIYAEHIKQGNLQEHLLNSMISALQSAYLEVVQSKAQTTEQKAPQAKKDEIFDDKAIQKSEERTAVNAAWQEAKKAWIEEGKNGILQHISDDYTKLTNLAQQSNTLQEFKDGFAKLDAEVKADAQNSERVSKTYPKTEKYATNATAPKSEPQVSNEPEPTAHQTQFGNGEDSAALNKLKADLPQNTQAARQDNKVSYSRTTHRQTQPNA